MAYIIAGRKTKERDRTMSGSFTDRWDQVW